MAHYYTDEKNAQVVLALLKAHGIRKIIASPGTTNIPITGSVLSDPFFEVYSAPDERSAAYLACGLSFESGEPVALSCTGATASRNYLPGLTEAWYRKLPVVAITSTPSLIDVGHLLPQCIDRSVAEQNVVKKSVSLPPIKDAADLWDCEIKVNAALLETRRAGGGPVHINLATSYTSTFTTRELPHVRVVRRIAYHDACPSIDPQKRVAVFIGAHKPFSRAETDALEHFVSTRNAVVLCDQTSSYRGVGRILSALACSQHLPTKPIYAQLRPDLVIHIGEVSGDYPTQDFIRASGAPVWRISEDGELRDRFRRLEFVFEMREQDAFQTLSSDAEPVNNTYLLAWRSYLQHIGDMVPELPFSNTWIAQQMSRSLPQRTTVHFGILSTLKNWNLFDLNDSIQTMSNVGGFGIDGCMSTLIGASLADRERLHLAVLGDLAFFYDLNSLGNRHLGSNVRILLVNNGGGAEFRMPGNAGSQFGGNTGDYIIAARHNGSKSPTFVKSMAEALGFRYLSANNKDDFRAALEGFTTVKAAGAPMLFECFTEMADDTSALESMRTLDKSIVVSVASKILPNAAKAGIKRLLNIGE